MIDIRRLDGTRVFALEIPEGSLAHRELMNDHYVKFKFTTEDPVYLRLGDYCKIDGFGRFELTKPYSPKFNTTTDGYDYNLQLDAHYIKWRNKKCRYNPDNAASETSFHLTATIDVHLNVIVKGINAIGDKDPNFRYEGQRITFVIRGLSADKLKAAKYKQYDNTDFISALNDLASMYDCEWWVEESIIYFGRCEVGDEIDFELNVNVEDMGSEESKNEYANRIIAFGSTKNLPPNYRKDNSADIIVNGVVQKRLMLPLSECPNGYVQDDDVLNETEAVEAIVIDDNIYPRTMCEVDTVTTYTSTAKDETTGEDITETYYRLTDNSGFNFSTDLILEGETLHILFQSGRMNGMDFECYFNDTEKYYEVVLNENYGRKLPDTTLHPEAGDKFILYGWDSTKIASTGIIEAAEMELYNTVREKLAKMKLDPNTHPCKMNSDWYEKEMLVAEGEYTHYDIGQKVRLINPANFPVPQHSRIIGYDIKLDIPYDSPVFTVGEASKYSKSESLQEQIDSIIYNGVSYENSGNGGGGVFIIASTSTTPSSDSNVHSAKRSDRRFLRKDANDTAKGVIDFEQQSVHQRGAQFGEMFVGGFGGVGGRIDGHGDGELESLRLRSWLEAPEIRYNRVSVYIGVKWDTFGGGIIEEITPDGTGLETGTGKLKLEEGEIGAIAVGDLCMGIWHDMGGGNATVNSDDNRGKFSFAGFKTVYFQITDVSGASNENFSYTLRSSLDGGNGVHPFAGMHFAGRGNPDDTERQAFSYTTTEYKVRLKGVTTWEFQPSNYYEISGHIEGFSMPAIDRDGNPYIKVFHGYGQVFGNAYIFGGIDQFERQEYRMEIDQSLNGSLAPGEVEIVTICIRNGYGEDVTSQFTKITVTRTTGDNATDAVWNASHTNVPNPFYISFSDLGIDGIHKLLATFNVTATDEATSQQAGQSLDYFS